MSDHSFEMNVGAKTRLVLAEALQTFSIGQVYNFIWRASKDAAAYYMRARVPKQQAANSVVGNIQRGVERAISEAWDVKSYGRDRRCPESTISAVLGRAVLHLPDPLAAVPSDTVGAIGAGPAVSPGSGSHGTDTAQPAPPQL